MKKTKEPDQKRIAALVKSLLKELGEDPARDGLKKTPERVAKMYEYLFNTSITPNKEEHRAISIPAMKA
jgi:GTP cyclohydrolase I